MKKWKNVIDILFIISTCYLIYGNTLLLMLEINSVVHFAVSLVLTGIIHVVSHFYDKLVYYKGVVKNGV